MHTDDQFKLATRDFLVHMHIAALQGGRRCTTTEILETWAEINARVDKFSWDDVVAFQNELSIHEGSDEPNEDELPDTPDKDIAEEMKRRQKQVDDIIDARAEAFFDKHQWTEEERTRFRKVIDGVRSSPST